MSNPRNGVSRNQHHPTISLYRKQQITVTEYEIGWEIADIFQTNSVGIATGRDKLTVHWTVEKLRETVADFVSLTEIEVKKKHNLKDGGDWNVLSAQIDLLNHPEPERYIQSIHYRPFDTRWTYYTGQSSGFHARPRHNIMRHLFVENLALCVCRVVKSPVWQHTLITDQITDKSYISNRTSESTYVFPLYLYPNPEELAISRQNVHSISNPAFLTALSEALELAQIEPFNLPGRRFTGGDPRLYLCHTCIVRPTANAIMSS